jgi:hypothetical protein
VDNFLEEEENDGKAQEEPSSPCVGQTVSLGLGEGEDCAIKSKAETILAHEGDHESIWQGLANKLLNTFRVKSYQNHQEPLIAPTINLKHDASNHTGHDAKAPYSPSLSPIEAEEDPLAIPKVLAQASQTRWAQPQEHFERPRLLMKAGMFP